METKKLTEKQIEEIKEIQIKYQSIAQEFGNIELQKISLEVRKKTALEFLNEIQEQEKKLAEEIKTQYGDGSINLETGEFNPSKEK